MVSYVALLRGINLGGHKKIAMDELRRLFVTLGHSDVKTYIQSGNVLFRSSVDKESQVARDIESRIVQDLGLSVTVLLRSRRDLSDVVAHNPLLGPRTDPSKLHVTFLAEHPDRGRVARLDPPFDGSDELSVAGREIYLHCPNGYGRTKLNNAYFERALGVAATTRSWKTVTKLHDLAPD